MSIRSAAANGAAAKPTKARESVVSSLFEDMDANETAPTAAPESGIAKKTTNRTITPKVALSPEAQKRKDEAGKAYDDAVNKDERFRADLLLSTAGYARGYLLTFVKMLQKITEPGLLERSVEGWRDDEAARRYFVTATKTKGLTPQEQRQTLPKDKVARSSAMTELRRREVDRIVTIWDAVAAAYFATRNEAPPLPDSPEYPHQAIAKAALEFVADDEK
jgi:hypothetical protein